MNHQVLQSVIFDQHTVIRDSEIQKRNIFLEPNGRYVLTGLRRAGKSSILYRLAQDLVSSGVDWNRIVYINFEDERLSGMKTEDLNDILLVQKELSSEKGYFFFDEIQNVEGWEKFCRRLADQKEYVQVTGSNAKALSGEIMTVLGARFMNLHVDTYSFEEYLNAKQVDHDKKSLRTTKKLGDVLREFERYMHLGGFPESLLYVNPRDYLLSVYQKTLLSDMIVRSRVQNSEAMRIMVRKLAETVTRPISYTRLHGAVIGSGVKVSKDSIIDYVHYAEDAYLIFRVENYFAKLAEKESNPEYYFADNGLLNLFLTGHDSLLLENLIAIALKRSAPDDLYFMKSYKCDVDFYRTDNHTAYQVTMELNEDSSKREIESIVTLSKTFKQAERFVIITKNQEDTMEVDGVTIEVIPAYRFLLELDI